MLLLHMYAPCAYRTVQLLRLLNIGDKQDKELHKCKDIGTLLLVYSLAFSKRSTATGCYCWCIVWLLAREVLQQYVTFVWVVRHRSLQSELDGIVHCS